MSKKVTMKDIADRLGVSSVTVSKALNDKEGVSDELKQKIKKVAAEMGYRYNTLAKAMKEGLSYNIGIVVSERFVGEIESFYMNFFKKLAKSLEKYDYYAILNNLSREDEKNQILPRVYQENRVDGIIVMGQLNHDYIDQLEKIDIPIIFLDFYDKHSNIDTVTTDNFYGAYSITNYLIEKGHKDIAFVGNIYATSSITDRFLGYCKSLIENRIEIKKDYIIFDRDEKGQYIEFKLPEKLPTAFVCNCDQVAYNLIEFLNEKGYRVPDDCSIVGFDNDIYAQISRPQLTTLEVDIETMANTAVELIMERIHHNRDVTKRVQIPGRIIIRDSVKDLTEEHSF